MAKAFFKAKWTDTNSDETITHIQVNTDSRSMIAHEVDPTTGRGWMNIGSVGANVTEFPFSLELPFTSVRVRVRPGKLGTRPTGWIPPDGFSLPLSVDGAPINAVADVTLDVTGAPDTEEPGEPQIPPPSSVTNLDATPGSENDEIDIAFTAVNDGTGAAAKYRVRYVLGSSPQLNWDAALPATGSCGTATPPSLIGDPVSCTITGLAPGTPYQVQVESYRGVIGTNAVFGGRSNIDTATTAGEEPVELLAPQNLQPTGNTTAGAKTFSWNAVANADEYEVKIHIGGQPYTPETVPTNYLVAGRQAGLTANATVAAGITYDWWVAGVNNNIVGPTQGAALVVAPGQATNPTPLSLLPSPTTVEVGQVRQLTVTLTNAYDQNITVNTQSNNAPVVTVPSSILIPAGGTTGVFNASGVSVGSGIISASYNGTTRQADITVTPAQGPGGGPFPNAPLGHALKSDWGFPTLAGSGWVDAYNGASLHTHVSNQDGPVSAPTALRARFPVGHPGGNGTGNVGFIFTATREMYVGYYFKIGAPFQLHPTAQKLVYFHSNFQNAHPFYAMIAGFGGSGNAQVNVGTNMRMDLALQGDSSVNNQHLHGAGGFFPFPGSGTLLGTSSNVQVGVWVRHEVFLRESSSLTSRDGIARWWVNGVQVGNFTNINTQQNGGFMGCIINPVYGGGSQVTKTQEDNIYYDHFHLRGGNLGA
jgi:hypothetical protein